MFFFLTLILAVVCIVGDSILLVTTQYIKKALVDNCTHFLIAMLSWLIVLLKCHLRSSLIVNSVFELLLCGFIASMIDVDHFFMARSLKLKYALNLGKKRPPFHCTTIPVLILMVCLIAGWILESPKVWRLGWITWVSMFSHHIRDGSRRGIWMWPMGSTPPLPYYLYIFITLCLPYFVMIPLKVQMVSTQFPIKDYITV